MIEHNIFIMSHTPSDSVAKEMVVSLMGSFDTALVSKDAQKKLPSKLYEQQTSLTDASIYSAQRPVPRFHLTEKPVSEDFEPRPPPTEDLLLSKVPVLTQQQAQALLTQSARDFYPINKKTPTSRHRYSSSNPNSRKTVRLDLASIKPNYPVGPSEAPQSVPSTALSRRAEAQLDNTIKSMRYTYLKDLRQQAKSRLENANKSQQLSPKKARVPKDFTHDYNFSFLVKRSLEKKYTVRSPVKVKEVSQSKIVNKSKQSDSKRNSEAMSVLSEMERAMTGTAEKKVRVYNNSSKRQVSHLPWISLMDNAKITENDITKSGLTSPKGSNSPDQRTRGSTFTSFYRPPSNELGTTDPLHTQQEEVALPHNASPRNTKQGHILKNSRLIKDLQTSRATSVIDFNPANVTRGHAIDRYYKLKAQVIPQ